MKKIILLVLVCMAFQSIAQQTALSEKDQHKVDDAGELLKDSRYDEAIEAYQEVLQSNTGNLSVTLKIAEAYLLQQDMKEALSWYAQAFKTTDGEQPSTVDPVHFYQYAECLLSNGQFEDALKWFELYSTRNPSDTRSARKIEGIHKHDDLKKKASQYDVHALSINSKYPDFSPSFYSDGLVFVSGREEAGAGNKKARDTRGAYLDLYYSAFDQSGNPGEPVRFSDMINTSFYEGPAVFYNHDTRMIFTRNNLDGKLKSSEERQVIYLQLFYSEKDTIRNEWKKPVLLSINTKTYSIGHPAISSDGQRLYFSSNMPGGFGGTDLYLSTWLNGSWGAPQNLGAQVNTEGNEMFPYLHKDSVLYFASNGHAGLGGLDVYSMLLPSGRIENMGAAINTGKDDFGLIINAAGNAGFFSSSRNSENKDKNDDIFQFKIIPVSSPPHKVVAKSDTVTVMLAAEAVLEQEVEVYYTVQILALINAKVVKRAFLKDLKGVLRHDGKDGLHRYTYGTYGSLEEATEVLSDIRAMGYEDAFVRKEERYKELSEKSGVSVEALYKEKGR